MSEFLDLLGDDVTKTALTGNRTQISTEGLPEGGKKVLVFNDSNLVK